MTVLTAEARVERHEGTRNYFSKHAASLPSQQTGPGVVEIMDALGKERSVARLRGREIVS